MASALFTAQAIHVPYSLIVAHFGGDFLRLHHARWLAATVALALPSTLFVAWLSFRYFETPFLNLKDRWTIRPRPAPASPEAGAAT